MRRRNALDLKTRREVDADLVNLPKGITKIYGMDPSGPLERDLHVRFQYRQWQQEAVAGKSPGVINLHRKFGEERVV